MPFTVTPCFHLLPWATTNLLSVSLDLPFVDIPYKWNHTICDPSCLASFTKHHVFEVHPHYGIGRTFLSIANLLKFW